ncbi:MAG: M48 family metalloprotease [Gammaproteobacteria bacterium]
MPYYPISLQLARILLLHLLGGLALLLYLLAASPVSATPINATLPDDYEDSLPLLGDDSSGIISLAEEKKLGRAWLQSLRNTIPISKDPQIQRYLESLLIKLSEAAGMNPQLLSPIVIKDPSINAFAAPGGIIGVNTGLFTKARSEGELSAVLAHELAHLSQRHYARRIKANKVNSTAGLVVMLATLLAILSGSSDNEGNLAVIYAGTAALQASALNYSRRDEREADRVGFRTLTRAGFSPFAAVKMFETLRESYKLSSTRPPEYLLTHPYTEERLADARNRANQLLDAKQHFGILDSPLFHLIQIRATLADATHLTQTILEQERAHKTTTGIERIFATYLLTLAYSRQNESEQALALLDTVDDASLPTELLLPFTLLKAEVYLASNQQQLALELLRPLESTNSGDYAFAMILAQALVATKQYEQASQLLRHWRAFRPQDPFVWERLADVQLLRGNVLEYHRSSARFAELNGRYTAAIQHMSEAINLAIEDAQLHQALLDQQEVLAELAKAEL